MQPLLPRLDGCEMVCPNEDEFVVPDTREIGRWFCIKATGGLGGGELTCPGAYNTGQLGAAGTKT